MQLLIVYSYVEAVFNAIIRPLFYNLRLKMQQFLYHRCCEVESGLFLIFKPVFLHPGSWNPSR